MDDKEIRELHLETLSAHVDGELARFKLKRTPRSTKYTRRIPGGRQAIDVDFRKGRYPSDAIAFISPHVHAQIDSVNAIYGAALAARGKKVSEKLLTINSQFGCIGGDYSVREWRPRSRDEYFAAGSSIVEALVHTAVPFLDDFQTPEQILEAGGTDRRLPVTDSWALVLASCAISVGAFAECRRVLESRFGAFPGRRRKYAPAIDYLLSKAGEEPESG